MIRLLPGDCRSILPTLPDASVQCVVSSPPYWGLRDYGTAQWEGGDAGCDHKDRSYGKGRGAGVWFDGGKPRELEGGRLVAGDCKCGARRIDRQIGLEPTPEAFIAELVAVFRQIRRVMRDDAVAFVNLGDSYQDKQLQMIPARVAIVLQADGWILRSDIIWAKPNPMPESCRDRPTSAHEHVFLLSKRSRYYYDADAVREPHQDAGRNLRNVWSIATAPFPAAHFATFPPELAERCIRAGTSERGCCAACGAPWVRITDTAYERNRHGHSGRTDASGSNGWDGGAYPNLRKLSTTTGWSPSCTCGAETKPCVILDPFSGAGTALLVADRLGRDSIGIDLSHQYVEMARERLHADCPLFADISPPPAEDPEDERMRDLFAMAAD